MIREYFLQLTGLHSAVNAPRHDLSERIRFDNGNSNDAGARSPLSAGHAAAGPAMTGLRHDLLAADIRGGLATQVRC